MPRYEFSEGTSNKFWEIKLSGTSFTTTYGKIGTAGQTSLKEFSSEAEAKKEHDKLIAEKTKKGYALVGGGAAAPAPVKAEASKPAAAKEAPKAAAKEAPKAAAKEAPKADAAPQITPGARYFDFVEGSSSKFWEVRIDGETLITRYGKIGTAGSTTEKELDSRAAAFKEQEKLIAEKTKKGYVERGGAAAEPSNPELERAIQADPYDASAYMVLADWLQGQGAPRGELISLQLATEGKKDAKLEKKAAALIEQHAASLLGPLAAHVKTHDGNDKDAFTWRFGFIHGAKLSHNHYADEEFDGSLAEVLDALLRHPSGRFLTELTIGFNNDPNEDSLDELIAVLIRNAPPTLRKLHLGDFEYPDETEMSWYHVGKLDKLWKAVPQLRSLIVQGGDFDLGTIELPALTHAEFRTGGLTSASAKAIAKATWPKLESLEVWYGDENYGGTTKVADAAALLERSDLTALRSLGLRNAEFTDELPAVLASSKLLKQLTRVDLSMGVLTDEGARALVAHKAAFAHLDELDVANCYLSKAAVASLKGVAKKVVADDQRDDDDPEYRHPSVGE